jgi:hypothetical protein
LIHFYKREVRMQDKERVWVAEPRAGFVLGKIVTLQWRDPLCNRLTGA